MKGYLLVQEVVHEWEDMVREKMIACGNISS